MRIEENYSLQAHNSFRLPVRTRWFIEYGSEDELLRVLRDEYFRQCDSLHIGSGSNLLFLNDYAGVTLHSSIRGIEVTEDAPSAVVLRVGAAEPWDGVVARAVAEGWYGVENLSGIPGESGAAAVQNIGAYGVEFKDVVCEVETFRLRSMEKRIFTRDECRYAYRQSRFRNEEEDPFIVTHIRLRLSKTPSLSLQYGNLREYLARACATSPGLQDVRRAVLAIRSDKLPDPAQYGNAGSFFLNPAVPPEQFEALKMLYPAIPSFPAEGGRVKIPAGWLIEQCGFKGKNLDGVGIYHRQALVLTNLGSASGQDIALAAEQIRAAVFERFRIELIPEVRYIG
jgi:UDP-N-acetylmuramate dehydrogenase